MSTPIQFGELPPSPRGSSPTSSMYNAAAAALRQRPKEWALISTATTPATAGSTANRVRHGGLRCFRPGGTFEATTRGRDVWARYIGGSA